MEAYSLFAGFEAHQAEHIKIAVDEACTNIIEHAYHNEQDHSIEIILTLDPKKMVISLLHDGFPFDASKYKKPNGLRASLDARKGGGWGIYLMNKLMDKVEYNTHKNTSEIRLTKKRD